MASTTFVFSAASASDVGGLVGDGLTLEFGFLVLESIRDLLKGEIFFLVVDNLDSSLVLFVYTNFKELGKNLFRE